VFSCNYVCWAVEIRALLDKDTSYNVMRTLDFCMVNCESTWAYAVGITVDINCFLGIKSRCVDGDHSTCIKH
jgi:hypothetical protein